MAFKNSLARVLAGTLILGTLFPSVNAEARRKHHRRRHLPPVTHPVVLWSRTLSESTDREQRKIAAFKLSQYTQPIFQDEVINTLINCMKDPDVHIKVLCAKAMSRAGNQSKAETIREALIKEYKNDSILRNTLTRTFIARADSSSDVHDLLLDSAKKSKDTEELLVLLSYEEAFGRSSDVDTLVSIYRDNTDVRVKRAAVKALSARGQGQDSVIDIFTQCTQSKDTPLALTCLAGLQAQARTNAKTWAAIEKSIQSTDPDVLLATLDLIHALPDTQNTKVSHRLVEIINETDDSDVLAKAVLALDVCGDRSEEVVKSLQKLLDSDETEEGTRISAALVLGKQATSFATEVTPSLARCAGDNSLPSLKTACQLGMQELEAHKVVEAKVTSTPIPTPTPQTAAVASQQTKSVASSAKEKEKQPVPPVEASVVKAEGSKPSPTPQAKSASEDEEKD